MLNLKALNRMRLAVSSMVAFGILAGSGVAFAATQYNSWGYDYLNDGGLSGLQDTSYMGAQTNSNYILINGGTQTINWGDGTTGTGGINVNNPMITWSNTDQHTYANVPNKQYYVSLTGFISLHNTYYGTYSSTNFSGLNYTTNATP